jgi:hypothetical protein
MTPLVGKCAECGKSEFAPEHDENEWADGGDGHPFERKPIEEPKPAKRSPGTQKSAPAPPAEEMCWCGRTKHVGGRHFGSPQKKNATAAPPPRKRNPDEDCFCGREAGHSGKHIGQKGPATPAAARANAVPAKSLDDRVQSALHLAREISELEGLLTKKLDTLKEMLA